MSRLAGDDTCADKRIIAEDTPPYRRAKDALVALDVAELLKLRNSANRALRKVCFFLDLLPPEMRVHIYEWALVDWREQLDFDGMRTIDTYDGTPEWRAMLIDRHNFQQPPLLRTCRLIREEASAIYYDKNNFYIDCGNLDPSAAITFSQHAIGGSNNPFGMNIELGIDKIATGYNVMRWLRAYYHNQVVCRPEEEHPEWCNENGRMLFLIVSLFENVDTLKEAGVSWSVIEDIMENSLRAVSWMVVWLPR